jgi:hypothetical protein
VVGAWDMMAFDEELNLFSILPQEYPTCYSNFNHACKSIYRHDRTISVFLINKIILVWSDSVCAACIKNDFKDAVIISEPKK